MTMLTGELLASFKDSITDVATAVTLPPEIYTSEEFLAFERRALFEHEWCCVGVASRIPEAGDWFTATVSTEPIIVARQRDGAIGAFSAICRHRGMQVVEGEGNSRSFRCPYHHWSYRLDGRLMGAPAMEQTEGFDNDDWGLPNLAVELWHGFIFVNFNPDAPPLAPSLERYEPYLANYELDNCVCPGTFTLEDLPWNWKVMFENFNDGYHANRLHQVIQDFCPSEMS
ncbi:MAG: aromatic ring-hydroxylating dioxygenase subunit alpha, partial [bacterium]|nr:aromatic ring-hydroxylating dioxygenase subunit alpha [bacterium]